MADVKTEYVTLGLEPTEEEYRQAENEYYYNKKLMLDLAWSVYKISRKLPWYYHFYNKVLSLRWFDIILAVLSGLFGYLLGKLP